jgi:putative ABC transport system permease protein
MNLFESMKMAFDSIFAHKLRSILTMLGIIIGVSSVTIIVAIGQGGTDQLTESVSGTKNQITIVKKTEDGANFIPFGSEKLFTQRDIEGLKRIPGVDEVIANSMTTTDVFYRDEKISSAFVIGITTNEVLQSLAIKYGRFFRQGEFLSSNGGVILSQKAADKLFSNQNPVGQIMRIGSQPVPIVGVTKSPTGLASVTDGYYIYLPSNTFRNVFGQSEIIQVSIKVKDLSQMDFIGQQAVSILNKNHNKQDGYEVQNLEQQTAIIEQIGTIMTTVIGSIGGISLIVGGIGVMNIMLVSVTERTREIGIRKSLGATRGNILQQFLIEAITLCVLGGVIGLLIAILVTTILDASGVFPATVSFPVAIGAILFSILFGVIFGLLPANKAAKLNPIECLRHD